MDDKTIISVLSVINIKLNKVTVNGYDNLKIMSDTINDINVIINNMQKRVTQEQTEPISGDAAV